MHYRLFLVVPNNPPTRYPVLRGTNAVEYLVGPVSADAPLLAVDEISFAIMILESSLPKYLGCHYGIEIVPDQET